MRPFPLVVLLVSALLAVSPPAAQALASSAPPQLAAWTPSTTAWIGRRRSAFPSIDDTHRVPIMTRGGSGSISGAPSPSPTGPLLGSGSSSAALELEAGGGSGGGGGGVVGADADGVVLHDGRRLCFGFRPRGWVSYLIVWANAVLLTFARKRLLPFRRHWHIKGACVGRGDTHGHL